MRIQALPQLWQGRTRACFLRTRQPAFLAAIEIVGIGEVGIDQAGKDHSRQDRELERATLLARMTSKAFR
ncbi:hypothetical protein XAXN_19390 [Xanthomonas axonopodis]|uniref:Uncharacterized protein n=1 Tax=Xanthomonas axonopodis TaxID=53413 RepID=A0A0P6VA12_9XANT|nr:hypothetical protein XAXN_19390 [Xanthomonas axonopodis]